MATAKALKHILVVEDDPTMQEMISNYLKISSFRVSAVADGAGMARLLENGAVDLIILDLKLGQDDGLELLRRLGNQSEIPVIIITGHRREEADRVVGLELGADDYVTKPFGLRELLARIRAVLRRAEAVGHRPRRQPGRTRYRFARWEFNVESRRLTSPDGDDVPLTTGEIGLLTALLQSPQRVLSREQLLAASKGHDGDVFDRSIDVQILRLRRKLEADPSTPKLIKTERGAGYVLTTAVETL
jgi:two-component system, OmpR family, response regulator